MFNEDDEFDKLFTGGSPKSKFYDIVYVANRHLVEQEIHRMVQRLVILESMLDERDDLEKEIRSRFHQFEEEIEHHASNLYLEMTASIVSNNE